MSLNYCHQRVFGSYPRYTSMGSHGGMILTGKQKKTVNRKETDKPGDTFVGLYLRFVKKSRIPI
jgi:hypothetical protein